MRWRGPAVRRGLAPAAALILAACAAGEETTQETSPAYEPAAAPGLLPPPSGLPQTEGVAAPDSPVPLTSAPEDVPAIYMDLEADTGRPVSVVFAIDTEGEPGPSDDPAIRLTPEGGRCNPQELSRYNFAGDSSRSVFGPAEAARGIDAQQLPSFMAVTVSRRMIERNLAATPEDTRPQNVCTRKLWEQLVLGQTRAARAPTGQ